MGVVDSGNESQMQVVKWILAAAGRGSKMAACEGVGLISEPGSPQQDVSEPVR
jgi:hypothetical protein